MSLTETQVIQLALESLQAKRDGLAVQIAELEARLGGRRSAPAAAAAPKGATTTKRGRKRRGRNKMSEAHRQAIAEAMRLRWAQRRRANK